MTATARTRRLGAVVEQALPAPALLQRHAAAGAYTDCYAVHLPQAASLAQYVLAFYTAAVFRPERWLLARAGHPSSDAQAAALARGEAETFAAWRVEARAPGQILLAAGRTRSWLMVADGPEAAVEFGVERGVGPRAERADDTGRTLYFGSAVLPRRSGGMGWGFSALLGFHRLYSRVLLAGAARRLARGEPRPV